jgi:EAL domain-containing protein (putative c-di-GMP-specific phosphodiesterase class I)
VETEEQRAFLERVGCDEMQGFLLARPVPPDQIDTLFGVSRLPVSGSLPLSARSAA